MHWGGTGGGRGYARHIQLFLITEIFSPTQCDGIGTAKTITHMLCTGDAALDSHSSNT